MRAKKMFISAILITMAMLFIGGCGKQAEQVSAEIPAVTHEEDQGYYETYVDYYCDCCAAK